MINQHIEKARSWWVEQPSKVRLTVLVLVASVPLYYMVDIMFPTLDNQPQTRQKYVQPTSVFASTAGADKMDAQHTEAKLEALKNQIKSREAKIDAKEMEQKASENRLQQQIDQARLEAAGTTEKMNELLRQVDSLSNYITKNVTNPQSGSGNNFAGTQKPAYEPKPGQFSLNPIMKQQQLNQQSLPAPSPQRRQLSLSRGSEMVGDTSSEEDTNNPKLTAAAEKAKKSVAQEDLGDVNNVQNQENESWLSAGTVLTGTLVTGHNVPTSGNADRDPAPVMIKITKEGIMPNNFSIDLRGCIVIGSARGDLSTRRVSIRAETISCIDEEGRAIEQPLMASAQGPDGQGGMPAKMVTRFGEAVKQSAIAGVYSTLAETSVSLARGSGNQNQPDFNGVIGSAAAGGAVTGFDKIAEFYLELANEARPYLEMQPGIEGVDLVVQRGQSLKWKG
jgi:conjugal transfer pilus assembly protein TraB